MIDSEKTIVTTCVNRIRTRRISRQKGKSETKDYISGSTLKVKSNQGGEFKNIH